LTAAPIAPSERQEFRATVIPQPQQVQTFHSLEGKSAGAGDGNAAHSPGCEPRVSVQRDGDRVGSIRIQCTCGQVIELACIY
jgi:hypothetical protein